MGSGTRGVGAEGGFQSQLNRARIRYIGEKKKEDLAGKNIEAT
jgi:hypothetical protein